jgi:hypothetical protein
LFFEFEPAGTVVVRARVRLPPEPPRPARNKDLVAGSGLVFEEAGEHELRGVPERWRVYRVVG